MIDIVGLGAVETLAAVEANFTARCERDAELLRLAAHWADLHSPDSVPAPTDTSETRWRKLTGRHPVRLGGDGTPEVLADRPAELGLVLQTSSRSAKHLIADALDLRHRLPLLWADVHAGGVRAWKARQVAVATRHLPLAVMAQVDAGLAGLIGVLPWTRFAAILEATIARADPIGTRAAEEAAASQRFVAVGRANEHHIKTLIARGDTLDIVSFLAAVHRIADILQLEGDPDPVDVRRSKALGVLARPDHALALLTRHQHDPDQPEPAPEPTGATPAATGVDEDEADQPGPDDLPDDEPDKAEPEDEDEQPEEPEEPDNSGSRSLDLTGQQKGCGCRSKPPRINLYVHLTDAALSGTDPTAVCRVDGVGPITAATVKAWLGGKDISVVVRPVAVPGEAVPVDAYEIPQAIREAVRLRNPASAFPWSSSTSRTMQLDHNIAYRAMADGGPPGQTNVNNLGFAAGGEHNLKTHSGWPVRQPAPGVYLWRSPHGWISLVTNTGTHNLGNNPTAHALWRAAAPPVDEGMAQPQTRSSTTPPDDPVPGLILDGTDLARSGRERLTD